MTEPSSSSSSEQSVQQSDFEKIAQMVSSEFQVGNALVEHNVPTFYLKQPQETKQSFLNFLKALKPTGLTAILRRIDGNVVLRVVPKPPVKSSNILINWLLLFATVGTTFVTGYLMFGEFLNPIIGGATFSVAIMAILGSHEMSHKLTANRKGIDATPPYFIPGPPSYGPLLGMGTFGAVIMQKSLPPNRDALFDVGASGPIIGFIVAAVATVIGIPFSPYVWMPKDAATLPIPLLFTVIGSFLSPFGAIPPYPASALPGDYLLGISLHPVVFAGWVGMIVTMLNILPAAMLDGGHVSRAVFGEKTARLLTWLSIIYLVFTGFWPMAFFVLFISMSRHPGPLDEVSALSTERKVLSVLLVVILVLCSFPPQLLF